MKKTVITLFFSILTIFIYGQSKISTQKKPTNTKPEIDRLAEKYKDNPNLTLFTSHGDLDVISEIDYNSDDKPQAIRIKGRSTNKDAIAEFLSGVISQKIKQGYKVSDGNWEPTDASYLKETLFIVEERVRTFRKGSMYFIVKGGCCQKEISSTNYPDWKRPYYDKIADDYWFSIETGDNNRKGGNKATKFDF